MPTPTIPDGELFMNATLYTGNGTSLTVNNGVAGQSFQPDFVWIKQRNGTGYNMLFDSVRGVQKWLTSNDTLAETTGTDNLSAFNSNGFTVLDGGFVNPSSGSMVAWQWKAGGAAVTNTAGSISAQVSANTTSGFSVVTYTGVGGSGTTTVGHGLNVSPSMVIIKRRNSTTDWATYHTGLTSTSYYLFLNSTAGQANYGSTFISPSSSTLTIDAGSSLLNASGGTYVAYCFAQIAGYSAFGSYTGNGSTDGPFIYTGFRPRFVMFKVSSTSASWVINDSARNTYNVEDLYLIPNNSNSEGTLATVDFLSNGFKLRTTDTSWNQSSATYIYMAFAESPFKYANAR